MWTSDVTDESVQATARTPERGSLARPKDSVLSSSHGSPFWSRSPVKKSRAPPVPGTLTVTRSSGGASPRRHEAKQPERKTSEAPPSEGKREAPQQATPAFNKELLRRTRIEACLVADNVSLEAMRKACWGGVPEDLRAACWRVLLGYAPTSLGRREQALARKRSEYGALAPQYESQHRTEYEEGQLKQIRLDMPRMHLPNALFQCHVVRVLLERVLYLFALRHPVVGYVQGMNDIASVFFVVFLREALGEVWDVEELQEDDVGAEALRNVEADTFWCLSSLLDQMQDSFTADRRGLFRMINLIEEVVTKTEPALKRHMDEEQIEFHHFCTPWINCLLLRSFPLHLTLRLWDTCWAESEPAVFHPYVCAAFLNSFAAQIKQLGFQEGLMLIQNPPTDKWTNDDMDVMLGQAFLYQSLYKGSVGHL